jgi:ADP-ribose pyrophosphatase YjhB (NUDIX family)
VRRLQAIAQNGLQYTESPFERERFEEVRAVAAELAAGDDAPLEELAASFASQSGHACPKVDVRAVAIRDGEVLLVRGRDDGLWTVPGGWAEVGESPRRSAEKELLEESGYRGRATRLVGLWEVDVRHRPRWPFYGWKIVLLCELEDAEPQPHQESEILDVGFFPEHALPELSGRIRPEQLALAFAHHRDPTLQPVFE